MTMSPPLELDAVIFGGGAAGLWLLDELTRRNLAVLLLEANDLGSGQTIASQGIIHGGLKYTLSGMFSASGQSIREMPDRWRKSLAGESVPNLTRTRLRAPYCHIWDTGSFSSKLAMIGAKTGLRVKPVTLEQEARPEALTSCRGSVARLDEQIIDPVSFIADLAGQHRDRLLLINAQHGLEFAHHDDGGVHLVRLLNPKTGEPLDLALRNVILTAGEGNELLRKQLGLDAGFMQRRPLHMVMARGALPVLNAHCVDLANAATPRLTITSAIDVVGRTVWQIGGQIAESGVERSREEQVQAAKEELDSLLPHVKRLGVEWSTYRVDRAEAAAAGKRPDDVAVRLDHNVITAWPTKLALVPKLSQRVVELLDAKAQTDDQRPSSVAGHDLVFKWPHPGIALPPWEQEQQWFLDD